MAGTGAWPKGFAPERDKFDRWSSRVQTLGKVHSSLGGATMQPIKIVALGALALLVQVGCGSAGTGGQRSGPVADAGQVADDDAGPMNQDAGAVSDAGDQDAGPFDAGVPVQDAGPWSYWGTPCIPGQPGCELGNCVSPNAAIGQRSESEYACEPASLSDGGACISGAWDGPGGLIGNCTNNGEPYAAPPCCPEYGADNGVPIVYPGICCALQGEAGSCSNSRLGCQ